MRYDRSEIDRVFKNSLIINGREVNNSPKKLGFLTSNEYFLAIFANDKSCICDLNRELTYFPQKILYCK